MHNMKSYLKPFLNYNNFQECIIRNAKRHFFGLNWIFEIEYIWDSNFDVSNDYRMIELTFSLVQEIHFINSFNASILENPNKTDWGVDEISLIIENADSKYLMEYKSSVKPMRHFSLLWEDDRRIDIICNDFIIREVFSGESSKET